MKLYKANSVITTTKQDAYQQWTNHYQTNLKRFHDLFKAACTQEKVTWDEYIDLNTFSNFVFNRSSKYLSQWA